jgi:hypothetical protein
LPRKPVPADSNGLWKTIRERWQWSEHELVIVQQAERVSAICDRLSAVVEAEGMLVTIGGHQQIHPALAELRQQQQALARLVVALRIPDEHQPASRRGQRRAIRGYQ